MAGWRSTTALEMIVEPNPDDRTWAYCWFEEAATREQIGERSGAEHLERVAMAAVEGMYEYYALMGDIDWDD